MSLKTTETLQRLFSQFVRDSLGELPPDQRAKYQALFDQRAAELARKVGDPNSAAPGGASPGAPGAAPGTPGGPRAPADAFSNLMGLGGLGAPPFDVLPFPRNEADFDEAVIPTQLHSAAELYYLWQFENMKVFQVASVLMRLFHEGRMRIQRGPGARALYLLEKHYPLRYKARDRMLAYRRAFNYGGFAAPPGAVVFNGFHRQFVAFNAAVAQYFRDLLIGEVIRGSQLIDQRPFGSQATIQRLGQDLRWQLDRSTYGFIVPLVIETGDYLKTVMDLLDTPDIKKAWDANTKWDVIELVSQRHLGGIGNITQRVTLAETGRRLLRYLADDPFKETDFNLFQAQVQPLGTVAEEWIAAYRMTPEGRGFPGVAPALKSMIGVPAQRTP